MPELTERCIESWRKFCPDYEIKEWNEDNFDRDLFQYTKEAYDVGKWAFVSDVARLCVLYHEGGIYLDTDVELISGLDIFLDNDAFSGFESHKTVATGIMGSMKSNKIIEEFLEAYLTIGFIQKSGELDTTTNVMRITRKLMEYGLKFNGEKQIISRYGSKFKIYPIDYFCPKSPFGEISLTENTHAIHHFDGSWLTPLEKKSGKRNQKLCKIFGKNWGNALNAIIFNYEKGGCRGVVKKIRKKNRNYL